MGGFDFLKTKEFEEIKSLKQEGAELRSENNKKEERITALDMQVSILSKYQTIVDADAEIVRKKTEFEKESLAIKQSIDNQTAKLNEVKEKYSKAYTTYTNLKKQCSIFEEIIEMADFGMYAPHFSFDTSEEFKEAIEFNKDLQKVEIKYGSAVRGGEGISWNGSVSQGQAMVKREKKLMLRAFNGECNSFISNVSWNNVTKMEERIQKSFEGINKIYATQGMEVAERYLDLKIEELRLTYEYRKKKQEDKEEQRAIREQMREEEKALREAETAKINAEKEEEKYKTSLEKAREELAKLGENEKLTSKIAELEARLVEAVANKERAISMAQQTKRGHVYVISNIGSFGDKVYKIGMTRRLDPSDRVKELGDASVPFPFDVHAMIVSQNAPELERALHQELADKRVNMMNTRREFFNVTLDEVKEIVLKNHGDADFIELAEAQQYRETIAQKNIVQEVIVPEFSSSI